MAKQGNYKNGRRLKLSEMIELEDIFEIGKRKNVFRLWRHYWDQTQTGLAMMLGVHSGGIGSLERWGVEKSLEGEWGERYGDSVRDVLKALEEKLNITPEMLGLQYEGLPTRFSKPAALNRRQQSEVCGQELDEGG